MKNAPPDATKAMEKWMKPTEQAIVKGFIVQSNDPAQLDKLIDAVSKGDFSPNGVQLQSRSTFGEGRQFYMDYDFIGLMKAVAANDPKNPAAPVFAKLTPGAPMLFALGFQNGRLVSEVSIPVGPISNMVKTFQEMGANMEKGNPKPPDKEKGAF